MDHPKSIFGCFARATALQTLTRVFALMLVCVTIGCTAAGNPGTLAGSAGKETIAEPDESQLQVPPLRFTELMPVDPQPTDDSLRPGLAVTYFLEYFERHLDKLSAFTASPVVIKRVGKPIPYLNHRFGREEVFDSGTNRGVAMRMGGLIRFPKPGEYTFRALSNDGLRVYIGDTRIIDDPTQHSDQYAVQAVAVIGRTGWYPLKVEYFQRKGTASIALFWQTPAASGFVPVPAANYAHLP